MIDNPYLNGAGGGLMPRSAWRRARGEACSSTGATQIQWGDYDPANIVYYPRYFAMFDDSTAIMFEKAGYKQDRPQIWPGRIPMADTARNSLHPRPMATGSIETGSRVSGALASR
jgi:hypothetical protein